MTKWDWLEKPHQSPTWGFIARVIVKAGVLFLLVNVLFAACQPLPTLGRLSLYNTILPGRDRLPYGENPTQSYTISLNNIPAMFASHSVSRPKAEDEFRVILLGDSATWGWLQTNEETLAAQINAGSHTLEDGRRIVAYNTGYPIMSLMKDLLLLDAVLDYQPDLIVWLITLESFPRDKQLFPPLVQNNTETARRLIADYDLNLNPEDARLVDSSFLENTLIGQRRALADLLRYQLYGFSWAATGIDQVWETYTPLSRDYEEDLLMWQDFTEPQPLTEADLAFDVLLAGRAMAGDVPIVLVNEPMFISDGLNSHLRYNFFYPRWAYDSYRSLLIDTIQAHDWPLLDTWQAIPPQHFTDSPVHMTAEGTRLFADMLIPFLITNAR